MNPLIPVAGAGALAGMIAYFSSSGPEPAPRRAKKKVEPTPEPTPEEEEIDGQDCDALGPTTVEGVEMWPTGEKNADGTCIYAPLEPEVPEEEDVPEYPPVNPIPKPGFAVQPVRGDTLEGMVSKAYGLPYGGRERLERTREVIAHPKNLRFVRASEKEYNQKVYPDGVIPLMPMFGCSIELQYASPDGVAPNAGDNGCYPFIFFPEF
jgi:hypothetical protein